MSIESLDHWRYRKASKGIVGLRAIMPKIKVLPAAWQLIAKDDRCYRDTPPALLHVTVVMLAIVQFGFVHRIFETFLKG